MNDLVRKDRQFVWHPFTQHATANAPLVILKAEGSVLIDDEGDAYIDANSSWWVNTHGHANEYIGRAITEQFTTMDHIVFAGVTHPKAVELSERICGVLPEHFQKVFFSDNGSTSVEVALKMAIQYWYNKGENKQRFAAMKGSYHGDTFGAMSIGQRGYFNTPFEPLFFDTDYLDFPTSENESEVLKQAEELFSTGEIAGVIVEPLVQGAAGMRMYSVAFLDALTELAHAYDVLVIFDEVMTGFGRTGKMFAMDHCEQKPDITALSKGLTAGVMALGLTVASQKIYDAFLDESISKALLHGHSFTANPIACAVACASLDLFARKETWEKVQLIGEWHKEFSNELSRIDRVKNIRQQGTILAFDIETGEGDSYFSDIKSKAYEFFLKKGVLLRPLGNTIFVNPPYCLTFREYQKIKDAIISFLQ